jgi:hypothetical protein
MTNYPKSVDATAMGALLKQYPTLTANGMENHPGAKNFAEHRQTMFSDRVLLEVNHCLAFLSAFTPIQTPNTSSYSLKHRAEEWGVGDTSYIHNGSAIAAGILLDLSARFEGLNPEFGISKPELDWARHEGNRTYAGARMRQPRGWDAFLLWRDSAGQS